MCVCCNRFVPLSIQICLPLATPVSNNSHLPAVCFNCYDFSTNLLTKVIPSWKRAGRPLNPRPQFASFPLMHSSIVTGSGVCNGSIEALNMGSTRNEVLKCTRSAATGLWSRVRGQSWPTRRMRQRPSPTRCWVVLSRLNPRPKRWLTSRL